MKRSRLAPLEMPSSREPDGSWAAMPWDKAPARGNPKQASSAVFTATSGTLATGGLHRGEEQPRPDSGIRQHETLPAEQHLRIAYRFAGELTARFRREEEGLVRLGGGHGVAGCGECHEQKTIGEAGGESPGKEGCQEGAAEEFQD